MNLALFLILLGLIVAVLVHSGLGIVLVLVGVFLLLVPHARL
jgi:hypothetical protein